MLKIQVKFFEGTLDEVQKEFNSWSEGKYVHDTELHFKGRERNTAVLKAVYGDTEKPKVKTKVTRKSRMM